MSGKMHSNWVKVVAGGLEILYRLWFLSDANLMISYKVAGLPEMGIDAKKQR